MRYYQKQIKIKQNYENVKSNRVRCEIYKIDFHRTSYARHLKCEKHLDNMLEKRAIIPRKNPVKRIEKKILKYLIQKLKIYIDLFRKKEILLMISLYLITIANMQI